MRRDDVCEGRRGTENTIGLEEEERKVTGRQCENRSEGEGTGRGGEEGDWTV